MQSTLVFEPVVIPSAPVSGEIVERNGMFFDFRNLSYSVVVYQVVGHALSSLATESSDYPYGLD